MIQNSQNTLLTEVLINHEPFEKNNSIKFEALILQNFIQISKIDSLHLVHEHQKHF